MLRSKTPLVLVTAVSLLCNPLAASFSLAQEEQQQRPVNEANAESAGTGSYHTQWSELGNLGLGAGGTVAGTFLAINNLVKFRPIIVAEAELTEVRGKTSKEALEGAIKDLEKKRRDLRKTIREKNAAYKPTKGDPTPGPIDPPVPAPVDPPGTLGGGGLGGLGGPLQPDTTNNSFASKFFGGSQESRRLKALDKRYKAAGKALASPEAQLVKVEADLDRFKDLLSTGKYFPDEAARTQALEEAIAKVQKARSEGIIDLIKRRFSGKKVQVYEGDIAKGEAKAAGLSERVGEAIKEIAPENLVRDVSLDVSSKGEALHAAQGVTLIEIEAAIGTKLKWFVRVSATVVEVAAVGLGVWQVSDWWYYHRVPNLVAGSDTSAKSARPQQPEAPATPRTEPSADELKPEAGPSAVLEAATRIKKD